VSERKGGNKGTIFAPPPQDTELFLAGLISAIFVLATLTDDWLRLCMEELREGPPEGGVLVTAMAGTALLGSNSGLQYQSYLVVALLIPPRCPLDPPDGSVLRV